jgi:DNA-binding NarL/FixJ family response regulator
MGGSSCHVRLKLLLVDDHAVVRSGLANMLSAQPAFEVVADVGNGEAALRACGECSPDVVILDVMMPGMGGIECLKRLKARDGDLRVLMLTSSEAGSDARTALDSGADGYVTKTSSSEELISAVHTVARGDRFVSGEVERLLEQQDPASPLTPREIEVLQLLRKGMSNPDIGFFLGITTRTAKAHVAAIMFKLRAQDLAEAVAKGFDLGLLKFGSPSASP